jgi:hypothetical protein
VLYVSCLGELFVFFQARAQAQKNTNVILFAHVFARAINPFPLTPGKYAFFSCSIFTQGCICYIISSKNWSPEFKLRQCAFA